MVEPKTPFKILDSKICILCQTVRTFVKSHAGQNKAGKFHEHTEGSFLSLFSGDLGVCMMKAVR